MQDSGLSTGLRALVARDFLNTVKYSEQQMRANRKGAHPKIVLFEKAFVRKMAKLGIPMFCHCMIRTVEDQKAAFVRGHSKKDGSKPYAHRGFAVDIIHSLRGWELSRDSWTMIRHIAEEVAKANSVKLVYGFDWKDPWDPAHFELVNWRELYDQFPFPEAAV